MIILNVLFQYFFTIVYLSSLFTRTTITVVNRGLRVGAHVCNIKLELECSLLCSITFIIKKILFDA